MKMGRTLRWLGVLLALLQLGDGLAQSGRRFGGAGLGGEMRAARGGAQSGGDAEAQADPADEARQDEAPLETRPRLPGEVGLEFLSERLRCGIGRPPDCDIAEAQERGLLETGLRPQFPAGLRCPEIDEGWAIAYSGKRGREQYHGGIDLPAPWGTPIRAAADGVVVGRYEGMDSYRGRELILRHRPEDTGLPFFLYTQYAHFASLPPLQVGEAVKRGQVLGPTGNSGIGRHGAPSQRRRPALHFAAWMSPVGEYIPLRGKVIPLEAVWLDPVALYLPAAVTARASRQLQALPESAKTVPVAVMREDGTLFPADARLIWPYTCRAEAQ
ncbi:MAG: hypothetical protein RIR00_215 [Pseudomonadota bacterium]